MRGPGGIFLAYTNAVSYSDALDERVDTGHNFILNRRKLRRKLIRRDQTPSVGTDERSNIARSYPGNAADINDNHVHRNPAKHLRASAADKYFPDARKSPIKAMPVADRNYRQRCPARDPLGAVIPDI